MTKIFPLIQINSKLYAIDKEAEIRAGDRKVYMHFDKPVLTGVFRDRVPEYINAKPRLYHKIIASQDETLGIALLPNIEEDDEILNFLQAQNREEPEGSPYYNGVNRLVAKYKAAKAKQYTEAELEKALVDFGMLIINKGWSVNDVKDFTKTLYPIPTHVELEMDMMDDPNWVKDDSKRLTPPILEVPLIKDGFVIVKQWIYEKSL